MIKLSGSSIRRYTTTVNHTGNDSGSVYTITHNLNTKNILADIYNYTDNVKITTVFSQQEPSTTSYGYVVQGLTLNSCDIRLFRWYPAPGSTFLSNKTATVIITAVE